VRDLTVDEAVAEFRKLLDAYAPLDPTHMPVGQGLAPEDSEEERFQLAEHLLRLSCPEAATCADQRCRRSHTCRHLVALASLRRGAGGVPATRRSPGASALRQAIAIYMNVRARRGEQ
jgi:hypothetical protein